MYSNIPSPPTSAYFKLRVHCKDTGRSCWFGSTSTSNHNQRLSRLIRPSDIARYDDILPSPTRHLPQQPNRRVATLFAPRKANSHSSKRLSCSPSATRGTACHIPDTHPPFSIRSTHAASVAAAKSSHARVAQRTPALTVRRHPQPTTSRALQNHARVIPCAKPTKNSRRKASCPIAAPDALRACPARRAPLPPSTSITQ